MTDCPAVLGPVTPLRFAPSLTGCGLDSASAAPDLRRRRSAEHTHEVRWPHGHTVVPRVRTVLSQTILPMVIPWNVARVPNFKSTSVSLPMIADPLGGSVTKLSVLAPSARMPVPLF